MTVPDSWTVKAEQSHGSATEAAEFENALQTPARNPRSFERVRSRVLVRCNVADVSSWLTLLTIRLCTQFRKFVKQREETGHRK